MQKKIPLFLAISIVIGLLTLFISSNLVFENLQLKEPLKTISLQVGQDTLSFSSKIYNVPSYVTDNNDEKKYYLNTFPGVLNWIVFHCVGLSLSAASLIFLIFLINNLKKKFHINFKSKDSLMAILPIALAIVTMPIFAILISSKEISGLVSGADMMDHFNIILSDPHTVIRSFVGAFLIIGLVALIGITVVNISISSLHSLGSEKKEELKQKFKTIKESLNIFALFSGLLLGVSIIGTGLQRDMIAQHFEGGNDIIHIIYPDTFIYSYGMAFTLILALFFLPSLVYLKYSKKHLLPENETSKESTAWWHIGKETLQDAKLIFSIIIPMLSSVIQNFI